MVMLRKIKPKNQRVKRALKARDPKVFENIKGAMVVRGEKTSQVIKSLLTDLFCMKKPHANHFARKNQIHPFEDAGSLEFFAHQNDCSLFAFGSHSKKRPHNLVLGRMFNNQVLDMFEMEVSNYASMTDLKGHKPGLGEKPAFVFQGVEWQNSPDLKRLQNLFLDFFRGKELKEFSVDGLHHVIVCSINEGTVFFRVYHILFFQSGSKVPRVELEECGPRFDAALRRTRVGDEQTFKDACQTPKEAGPKKQKNVDRTKIGDRVGRVHMYKQKFGKLQTRKVVALKKRKGKPSPKAGK
eukprot:c5145_g1_i2.p1 GENE.c5145_g1_i2~~c5145_g1_i2.p1  ORF type:complete len:310 (-),score=80.70 c5145_g1_i2:121-1011(-)